ncbi:MAG: hypothetical protein IRY89_14450 [Pseudolabrys sp.]|nr:hypothetical protein [Pseudolabrys sp.]
MPTNLKSDQMKQFVGMHFENFVNARNAAVIRQNMTPDFYDHDGPGGKPTGVWAFASRAHPSHGEIYFNNEAQNILPVFLDPNEKFAFRVTKVIHNCLMADRFPPSERPVRSDLEHGWPAHIRQRVFEQWSSYGYQ